MLVLPTLAVPAQYKQFIKENATPIRRMINGYRNKLSKQREWMLVNDLNYCGQAYCYPLIQDQTKIQKLKSVQNLTSKIENINNNFVVTCKKQVELLNPKNQKISQNQYIKIVQQLGPSQDKNVTKNIILNLFDSYEELKQSGLPLNNFFHQSQDNKEQIQQQNYLLNEFSGEDLYHVPLYDESTGLWTPVSKHKLKIQDIKTQNAGKQSLQQICS